METPRETPEYSSTPKSAPAEMVELAIQRTFDRKARRMQRITVQQNKVSFNPIRRAIAHKNTGERTPDTAQ